MYNLTNVTEANNIVAQLTAINNISGGLVFGVFYMVLFIATMIIFKKQDFKTVLVYDSFFMSFIMVLGFALGFITSNYVVVSVLLFLGSLVVYKFVE